MAKAWQMNKQKGDVLLFEADNGASEFFFEKELEELLNANANKMLKKLKTGKDIFE